MLQRPRRPREPSGCPKRLAELVLKFPGRSNRPVQLTDRVDVKVRHGSGRRCQRALHVSHTVACLHSVCEPNGELALV
jgi:hypothetical protein